MNRKAKTTAIEITPPITFTELDQQYRLVKYVLPRMLVFDKDKYKYAKMHNEIKEILNVPYRVFTKDYINGSNRWSLYALFPPKSDADSTNGGSEALDEKTSDLPVLNYDGEALPPSHVPFSEPKLHVLIKLLQVAYTRHHEVGQTTNRFVGRDKCYIYATRSGDAGEYHKCLEMEIRGDIQNENIFYIDGHSRTFALDSKINAQYININTYFTMIPIKDDLIIFNQVRRSAVRDAIEANKSLQLYKQIRIPGKRTTLDFHSIDSQEETEQTRGYLIDTFIRGFSGYLQGFGFKVEHISRDFQRFETTTTSDFKLPVAHLGEIFIYDVRFSKSIPLQKYLQALVSLYPSNTFKVTHSLDEIGTKPVIIIQDCEAKAFKEGMPLFGEIDPHEVIYQMYPSIPKQFLNVNSNELREKKKEAAQTSEEETAASVESVDSDLPLDIPYFDSADDEEEDETVNPRERYLSYDLKKIGDSQAIMLMNQLFLKDLILNQQEVPGRLPTLSKLMYVHREHQIIKGVKRKFEVALYVENLKTIFLDLVNSEEDKDTFYKRIDAWEVDWEGCSNQMRKRRRGDEDGKDLPDFDVIVGPKLFVEISGGNEAILYPYDEIIRRHGEQTQTFELDDLKLAARYDEIIDDANLTEEMLQLWGYLQQQSRGIGRLKKPKNAEHRAAIQLYEALHEYDALLEKLKGRYPAISFYQLTTDEDLVPHIVKLFGSPQKLQNIYKKVRMFLGLREADMVSVYTGIWYTNDLRYVVGDSNPMNSSQAKAHRVRQFHIYQGNENLDITPFLEEMSVTFVRLNQYTVYPYHFNLIDIYIDSILEHRYKLIDVLNLKPDDEMETDEDIQ